MINPSPKVLILATSYAPELQHDPERLAKPRTDYIELAKMIDCDIIDYSYYDNHPTLAKCRPFENRFRLDFILALEGVRRCSKYDITLLMSERAAIPFALICKCLGRKTQTVMMSMHSSPCQAKIVKSLRLYEIFSRTISFTPAQKDFLTLDMNIAENSISYVPYAVDDDFYKIENRNENSFVLSAGGIPGRDYETLLDAIKETNIPLWIVTGGRSYGRKTSGGFDQLPPNVKILSGQTSDQMRNLYSKASIVIIPLKKDRADAAGSSVALEAMSAACPLVASSSPGIKHYLHNNVNSILVEPENTQALKDTIQQLITNSSKKTDLGRHAVETINRQLSMRHYIKRLQRVIYGETTCWPLSNNHNC